MSKKSNKPSKKVKKPKKQDPFEFGLDAEQTLADTLCEKFLKVGVEQDAIDDAFIGAFNGLAHRMFTIFKPEFVFELAKNMAELAYENQEEHVCNDCKAEHEAIQNAPAHKGTVH